MFDRDPVFIYFILDLDGIGTLPETIGVSNTTALHEPYVAATATLGQGTELRVRGPPG